MFNPYKIVLDLIIIILFAFAFLTAENKGKITLTIILLSLLLIPRFIPIPSLSWIYYTIKILFGLGCYLYIKTKRLL